MDEEEVIEEGDGGAAPRSDAGSFGAQGQRELDRYLDAQLSGLRLAAAPGAGGAPALGAATSVGLRLSPASSLASASPASSLHIGHRCPLLSGADPCCT
jgi:hypothetical protein